MPAGDPLVVICALRGRLFCHVESAVIEQWPDYAAHVDEPYPLRTYADFVRTIWQGLGDIVIVEGDSVPPPGSIRALLTCPEMWCSHPSWVGDRYLDDTLGLCKFSCDLQRALPRLADSALSRPHMRTNRLDRSLGMTAPTKYLGPVPLDASVLRVWPGLAGIAARRVFEPGTTIHPKAIDMALGRALRINGIVPHVHMPPAPHLRYANDPALISRQLASR